ncbi:MAG: acetyltransferase [Hydrogenophaga sp.]|uniref:PglD-related sugar-binding protein n=1 Tax=Hydrogenophaga sp. TaxID=1904254 RepID=UPI001DE0441C|nr:acetyltransferase [Hydrogenophaga sp.]MBX3611680.1 acetyltransferase [Hydrogenophaga sp.]
MDQPLPLVIVGAGGHGRSVLELVRQLGAYIPAGFLDDTLEPGTEIMGMPVLGSTAVLADLPAKGIADIHVAIGHNSTRQALLTRAGSAGLRCATLVHPRAFIAPSATVGSGCAVMAMASVGTEAVLADGAIVNMGAVVDHHARVGPCGHLGANATMAGGTSIGARAWMQAGSAIGYHVHLPDDAMLAPGEGRA